MTLPSLTAIALPVVRPVAEAGVLQALGLHVVTRDDAAEARFDDGIIARFLRADTAGRIRLRFAVRDVGATALALAEHQPPWTTLGCNVIRIERGDGLAIDAAQAEPGQTPGLTTATLFVRDVAATDRFWAALGGVTIGTAGTSDGNPVNVLLGGVTLRLQTAGDEPVTQVHLVLRVSDVIAAAQGLLAGGVGFEMDAEDPGLTTWTPDGCGVRVTQPWQGGERAPEPQMRL